MAATVSITVNTSKLMDAIDAMLEAMAEVEYTEHRALKEYGPNSEWTQYIHGKVLACRESKDYLWSLLFDACRISGDYSAFDREPF